MRPLWCTKSYSARDWSPGGLLSWNPIRDWENAGFHLRGGNLEAVRVGRPTFARIGFLIVLPLLPGGVDIPHEVVGEWGLREPVVLVCWLRERLEMKATVSQWGGKRGKYKGNAREEMKELKGEFVSRTFVQHFVKCQYVPFVYLARCRSGSADPGVGIP